MAQHLHGPASIFPRVASALLVACLLLLKEPDLYSCMSPDKPAASKLMETLTKNYGPVTVRPIYDASQPTGVAIRIFVTQIIELNEREQFVQISGFMRLKWHDAFLAWNRTNYPGVERLYISTKDIWTPDITMYTNLSPGLSVDEFFERTKDIPTIVTPDGMVSWNFPAILKSSCQIDSLLFPFDIQRCDLVFASWVYTILDIDLFRDNETDQNFSAYFVPNGVWELTDVLVTREEVIYPCCPDTFPVVTFSLHLTRRPLHYILSILLPGILLAIISLSIYVLPPDSGEKISLGVTTLLALLLFQELISGSLPPSSDATPIIGYFFTPMVVIGCTSVLSSVLILNIHHRVIYRPVPRWLRYLILRVLAPILCYRHGQETLYSFENSGPTRSATIIESWPRASTNNVRESSAEGVGYANGHEGGSDDRGLGGDADGIPMNSLGCELDPRRCCHHPCCRELLKTVERMLDTRREGHSDPPIREWQEVALVLDRFMLLVSALTMAASITVTTVMFVIHSQSPTVKQL
ncbi:neuronal acetylcholine receptor subunit alpha-10-like isoform X1 [Acanthaster planci]|uniref:Neuronal acetylcholine receptor subunit alpha-10-like isoform X1 n=1 Tax=Acanthaster planci TaxID=133434 RepID=A0A8B7ZXK6_ACAPL|nr:neuronal acetylcholine receptor subunit alpha-10-like isoform X1 [Acanthaster planci]XP_022109483.1 neuronal acetylcholine receptor subunit alpha-10-like isoform X1 [Acanthaster planci]XP_022109485.1 neuronal acetylcholine receptor subunit alpha-10-like isoform X1 [Acanthaster planci]